MNTRRTKVTGAVRGNSGLPGKWPLMCVLCSGQQRCYSQRGTLASLRRCRCAEAPAAPSKLTYGRARRGSVTLEWETPTAPARGEDVAGLSGYLIERRDVSRDAWLPVKKLPPRVKSYEVPGLPAGRQYMFRVRSIGVHGGLGEAVMPETPFAVADRYSQYTSKMSISSGRAPRC